MTPSTHHLTACTSLHLEIATINLVATLDFATAFRFAVLVHGTAVQGDLRHHLDIKTRPSVTFRLDVLINGPVPLIQTDS